MTESGREYHFAAPVLRKERPRIPYHYIPVPPDIARELLDSDSRRVIARINGRDIRRSLFIGSDGEDSIMISLSFLKDVGIRPGDNVSLSLRNDPEPDRVDLCDEFRTALDQDEEAAARFYSMTTGKRRSIATYPNSAKRIETRIKRSLEICHKLRTRTLSGDRT
jgi:Bacteriocin-protection, YdeI or OmpD-Associated/Domain of unknown function (DUF1905)